MLAGSASTPRASSTSRARSLKNSSTPMDSPLEKPDIGYVDAVDQEVGELVASPTGGR
jgi:hypothetical protein